MGDSAKEGHHEIRTQVHFKAMRYRAQERLIYGLLVAAFLFCCTKPALGVILHPDGEPNLVEWTDRPDPNVVGRWGSNASCVAVSSNCVITVRHQGGGIDTVVEIGGGTYTVAEIWDYNTADLRVAKLYGANLRSSVGLYEDTNEIGKDIVISGYGDGRGGLLQTEGITYGYEWDNSANTTLRLGTNKVDGTENDSTLDSLTSDIIIADFDGLGEGNSTVYECIPAAHDSGGGWFIYDGNKWKVAGLSRTVGTHYEEGHLGDPNYILYEAWFRNRADPNILQPDHLDAVRISSYATWIRETIPERLPGDLTGDYWVDFADFAVFAQYWQNTECEFPDWCGGADCEPDGDVDWADLAALVDGWLCKAMFAENLIAHWKMNEDADNKDVLDSTGKNVAVADQNTDQLHTTGKVGGALTFNGSSDYIKREDLDYFKSYLWTKYSGNPVIPVANNMFGSVWKDGGTYHFYYSNEYDVYHRTSSDGISWGDAEKVLSRSPGTWDETSISVVMVWKENGTWYMLYRGWDNDATTFYKFAIGFATSSNGTDWIKDGNNPVLHGTEGEWDGGTGLFEPWGIIRISDTYYLWYNSNTSNPSVSNTGFATIPASDLTGGGNTTNWTKDSNNPIFRNGKFRGFVFKYGDYYYLVVVNGRGGDYKKFEFYRCKTPTFYKADRQRAGYVLKMGESGAFDEEYIDTPVILTTDIYRNSFPNTPVRCYYTGQQLSTHEWRHGLATFNISDLENYRWTPDNDEITICMWFKLAATGTQTLISKSKSASYYTSNYWIRDISEKIQLFVGNGILNYYTAHTIMPEPSTDEWHFICAGYDSNDLFSSVDGKDISTTPISFAGDVTVPFVPVLIGAKYGPGDYLNGALDDVMIFDRRLSQAEVGCLWNDGNGRE